MFSSAKRTAKLCVLFMLQFCSSCCLTAHKLCALASPDSQCQQQLSSGSGSTISGSGSTTSGSSSSSSSSSSVMLRLLPPCLERCRSEVTQVMRIGFAQLAVPAAAQQRQWQHHQLQWQHHQWQQQQQHRSSISSSSSSSSSSMLRLLPPFREVPNSKT